MALRTQLFLVSLLTLTLPWASCQFLREMENVQRQNKKSALLATAETVASTLPDDLYLNPFRLSSKKDPARDIYAYELVAPVVLDGFSDDWQLTPAHGQNYRPILDRAGLEVRALTGMDRAYVYLHIQVKDESVVYSDTNDNFGDRIVLSILDKQYFRNAYTISTLAPGSVSVQITGENPDGKTLTGFWQETVDGFNVELKIPQEDVGVRLGFIVTDVDQAQADSLFVLGSLAPTGTAFMDRVDMLPGILRARNQTLQDHLAEFVRPNLVLSVADEGNWQVAKVGTMALQAARESPGLLDQIYRNLLRGKVPVSGMRSRPGHVTGPHIDNALAGRPGTHWSDIPQSQSAVVSAAYPLSSGSKITGALVLQSTVEDVLLLADTGSASFINRSLLLTLGVALVLLGYASFLSIRIQRLKTAAEHAVSPEGQFKGDFPASNSGDEIGDLSRSFSTLLKRVQDYTNYLEGLAGRLSHELRTPLTIVRSSLDNLLLEDLDGNTQKYAQRARDGTQRLSQILAAMSEANRLEQSIRDHDITEFDVVRLLQTSSGAFADIYADHQFHCETDVEKYTANGSPDLIGQMLDKLVNNAVDFCDERKQIHLELKTGPDHYTIVVWNYGVPLPGTMTGRLFDSMVSIRDQKGKTPHLGLGLHIARMIAEFHGGNIRASNLAEDSGARFEVRLSRQGPG